MDWSLNSVRLECREWPGAGDARPLLLLHEGLGSIALWKDFPTRLAQSTGRRVIAYSRQGHGRSSPLAAPRQPDFMHHEADHLRRLLVEHNLTDAVLVGHSDGASIALLYAATHSCAGLVLLAPHVFVEAVTVQNIREAVARFTTTDFAQRLGVYHEDVRHTFYAWSDIWLDSEFREWNIEAETARVTAPTLVIQGRGDEYGTAAQYEAIGRAIPQADVLVLGRCGHSPHRDRPRAVLDAMHRFVQALDETAPREAGPGA